MPGNPVLKLTLFILLAGFSFTAVGAQEAPAGLKFSGESYTDAAVTAVDEETLYGGLTSFRLDMTGGDRQTAKVEASGIVRLLYGYYADTLRDQAAAALGDPLAGYLEGTGGTLLNFELKKLYLSVYSDYFDLSAGRMIVNYGRGTIFSPVDLFAGIDITDLSLGRSGTDAVRILVPLGAVSGLDLVATLPYPAEEMTGGIRGYTHLAGWDFGFSAFRDGTPVRDPGGDDPGVLMLGLDFQGDLILGVCGEGVVRIPWDGNGLSSDGVTASFMAGLDYSAAGLWFFDLEYLVNLGEGYRFGTFQGDHNLFASVSFRPDLLTSLDLRGIVRLEEPACQGMFSVSRLIVSRVTLLGYITCTCGDIRGIINEKPSAAWTGGLRLTVAF